MHYRDLTREFDGPQRVVEIAARGSEQFGDREMIVTPTERLTYAEVDGLSRLLAKRMVATGLGKGSRVAVHLPNGAEWLVAFFAATRIGALFMPFSAAYKPAELRKGLLLGDVHLLIGSTESWHGGPYQSFMEEAVPELVGAEWSERLAQPAVPYLREVWLSGEGRVPAWARRIALLSPGETPDVSDQLLAALEQQVVPADDAMIIWTSGTTADPKGAVHSQGTVARRAKANAHSHAYVEGDRVFCDFAFWWIGGPGYGFLPAYWAGATLLAVSRRDRDPDNAFLDAERPTRIAAFSPTALMDTVAFGEGSAHMTTPRGIGMTETFGPHSMHEPISLENMASDPPPGLGPTILGFERKIIDPETGNDVPEGAVGELVVRGPGMMRSLYRHERDEIFDADGWYHTGDRCWIEDGGIYFVSRLNEMIKTSGSNVAPLEVELALSAIPEIEEVAVFGIPDAKRGEQVVAVVVGSPGATLDEDAVRESARRELSNYKVPRRVLIMTQADLPRLHSGKVDKRALQQSVADIDDRADTPAV